MSKRITVVIDDELVKKLRAKQANMIKHSSQSVSFSSMINQELKKSLKK